MRESLFMNEIFYNYCGLDCVVCNCSNKYAEEPGNILNGTMKCEIEECAKEKKKKFCGECDDFPCDIIARYSENRDLNHGNVNIEKCKFIKAELAKEAKENINLVGYCGHHCGYCFHKQWCGGCRSNYNCCSFSVLSPDGICPNVKCARQKKLNGCYLCDELLSCEKGYYGRENEYIAKATALFIKEYREKCYTLALEKAIESGEDYPKSFDVSGSVMNAMGILKKYL